VITLTVFASSSPRTPERYLELAREFGRQAAAEGLHLVNGAGHSGCMGALNDACLGAGGRVRGVILRHFLDEGLAHEGLHELAVTETMRERKRLLGAGSDAFLVLPGGPGTWEEFWEVAVERQIGSHRRPLLVLDPDDYYAGFIAQVERAAADGFLYGPAHELFTVVDSVAAAMAQLRG